MLLFSTTNTNINIVYDKMLFYNKFKIELAIINT